MAREKSMPNAIINIETYFEGERPRRLISDAARWWSGSRKSVDAESVQNTGISDRRAFERTP